jgi:hypothetical protein
MPRYLIPPACLVWLLPLLLFWIAVMAFSPRSDMDLKTTCLFDVTCGGYDSAHAAKVIDELGDDGRQIYVRWHFTLDLLFPLIYGATLAAFLIWLATLNGFGQAYRWLVSIIPLLAVSSDLLENSFVLLMVASEPPRTDLAPIASVFTQIKCASLVASFILLLGLGTRAAVLCWWPSSLTR